MACLLPPLPRLHRLLLLPQRLLQPLLQLLPWCLLPLLPKR